MIQIKITKTSKSYSPKAEWCIYDKETKVFQSMREAMQWVRDTYGKRKRYPIYIDDKQGGILEVGFIIGFRSENWDSQYGYEKFLEQHWIHFYELNDINPRTYKDKERANAKQT